MKKSESIQIALLITFAVFSILIIGGYRFFGARNISVINVTTENYIIAEPYVENKVNINTADIDELTSLKGIGEVKAQSIIEYRTDNANFENIHELMNVYGISDSLFESIKAYISVE